ncbi:MAG: hypothetical protein ACR2OE_10120 [Thermomicrobiales bacterium]
MKIFENLRVGKRQTTPDADAHVQGNREGNQPGSFDRDPGLYSTGETESGRPTGKGTARRSTGVNPGPKNPIDPKSPNLSPP